MLEHLNDEVPFKWVQKKPSQGTYVSSEKVIEAFSEIKSMARKTGIDYHLTHDEDTWLWLRKKGMFEFTDEELAAARSHPQGFIKKTKCVVLHLKPKLK
jgi:beta-xylosidase